MLALLGTIFGSIFSGGATGLIGVVLQRYFDFKNKQLDIEVEARRQANAIELKRVDAEIMAQEWAARTKVAEVNTAGASDVAASQAFAASFAMEPTRYSEGVKPTAGQSWVLVILDAFRGAIRPLLTVYLCALTTLIYIQARVLLSHEDLTAQQAMDLENTIIGTILYLTTTCILWWFGTRNKQEQPKLK